MMKIFYFNLSLTFILIIASFNLNAQSPFYFDPQACEATLNINDSAEVHTLLKNATEDTVEFSFPGYTSRDQGGPDNYGYTWIDSEEPGGPDWAWTDISETGYIIEGLGDDNVVGPFEFPFEFPFYGQSKNHFWISANGCISFNDQIIPYANGPIPTNNNYIDFIAWFWDDLTIDTAITRVYLKNFEEKTIVQFTKMVHYPGTESFITAQVVMMVNGTILIRYRQMSEDFETISATAGLQSWNPELGLQVLYNQEYLHSELAVRFDLHRNFIVSVNPASGYLPPNSQETIWITYSSVGFEHGSYEQELKCVSNLPEYTHILLHNVMHVTNPDQAGFKGYVTNAATGLPINEVKVIVGEHYVYTNDQGHYELPLEQGSYNVHFIREDYQTKIVEDTTAVAGYSILDVELEGYYYLVGRVYAGENPIETGFAYGYKMLEGTVVDIYAEMVGEEGWYEFSGLSSAHYIVKAEPSPNSIYYGDYLPTYYGDVLHWEEATVINLVQSTDDAHINLVLVTNAPEGPGSISGSIDNGKSANIPIILRTAEPGTAVMTYSSTDGSFLFSNLAYGTYEIFAEIPGKSIIPQPIVLDEVHPSAESIDMMILESEIIFLGIAESEVFENMPVIYPNPALDYLNISLKLKKPVSMNIELADPLGRVIIHQVKMINGNENISLNLDYLPKGIYFLKLEANQEVVVKRFIKN
ncbi:MAG: T9SS type A sorting domain-containing protein [Bacteroidales bacterium]